MPKPTFFNLSHEKRQRFIDAAVACFSDEPYSRVSLDSVVARAGVSKGSLYQYFGGKADLYEWLLLGYMGERKVAAITAERPPAGSNVWCVLEHAVLSGVRFAAAEPHLTRLGMRFHRDQSLDPELAAIAVHTRAAGRAWIQGVLEDGVGRGEIRADLDLHVATSFVAYALGEGLIDQIAHTLGVSPNALLTDPHALQHIEEEALLVPVRTLLAVLREGIAPGITP